MKDRNKKYNAYSSKIKRIYIELHNYSFYHGPSEVNDIDERFIGRTNILEKLKSILSRGNTKSGVYLVTGHRGMGKSSFVNKAIEELNPSFSFFQFISRYFRIILFTIILNIFYIFLDNNTDFQLDLFLSIILLTIFIFITTHPKNKELEYNKIISIFIIFWEKLKFSFSIFHIQHNRIPLNRFINICQDVFISSLAVRMINSIYTPYGDTKEYYIFFLVLIALQFLINIGILLFTNKSDTGLKKFNKSKILSIKDRFTNLYEYIKIKIKNIQQKFNYINRIYIKINLGYDDLKPIDIFRLIARKLRNKYKYEFYKHNIAFKLVKFGFILLLYFLSSLLYNQRYIQQINENIKNQISFYNYFPSQLPICQRSTQCISSKIVEKLNIVKWNYLDSREKFIFQYATFLYLNEIHDSSLSSFTNYQIIIDSQSVEVIQPVIIQNYDNLFGKKDNKRTDDSVFNHYLKNASEMDSFAISIYNIVGNIDLFIDYNYHTLKNYFLELSNILTLNSISFSNTINIYGNEFTLLPNHIDYLFLIYIILVWNAVSLIIKKIFFLSKMSPSTIINDLEILNDMIDSEVSLENEQQVGIKEKSFFFNFFKKKKQFYYKSDVREIEAKLLEILNNIENLPSIFRPEFILIFDELDKIEPNKNIAISDMEKEKKQRYASLSSHRDLLLSPEGTRLHQNAILELLSSMKYFLTTAKMKFIFIAGREMYDAYLADVSRNKNSFDSIFHNWISVDSFYNDYSDNKRSDISSFVEWYLCQFLFPMNFKVKEYSLQEYNKYLKKTIMIGDEETIESKQKREKVIQILRYFVAYLCHMSHGSPKKLTSFFEKSIIVNPKKQFKEFNHFFVGNNDNNFYLSFDYFDQYKLGMIFYLINPITLSINNKIKEHGDKLLISSSYIIDHLFKFYRDAFSWRNLEFAREIIDINRTPELRNFIKNIIDYLSQTHINEIVSGLYTFRFPKRISMEISFLSKISEEISAAFNFTLDESLPVKQYHEEMLRSLEERYNKTNFSKNSSNQGIDFIHSVSMLHVILGDLKFYDEEYSEAIIEYMDSIQILRNKEPEKLSPSDIVVLIRNLLKLGFAFEKRQTFSSAFLTYGELTKMIVDYRDINLDEFGLEERWIDDENIDDDEKIWLIKKTTLNQSNYSTEMNIPKTTQAQNIPDRFSLENFLNSTRKIMTPLKEKLFFKMSTFEGIRLMYQPLIAKFQMIEKSCLGGISKEDVYRLYSEFNYLIRTINKKEKYLILSEFWNKAGDILYYKNGLLNYDDLKNNKTYQPQLFSTDILSLCTVFNNCNETRDIIVNIKSMKIPCRACRFYFESLKHFTVYFISQVNESKLDDISKITRAIIDAIISPGLFHTSRSNSYRAFAGLLSDIGNVFISCSTENELVGREYLQNLNSFIKLSTKDKKSYKESLYKNNDSQFTNIFYHISNCNKIEMGILFNVLSGFLYKKSNDHKNYSLQLSKIIFIFKDYLSVHKNNTIHLNDELLFSINNILSIVLKKSIRSMSTAYKYVFRNEINKMKEIESSSMHEKEVSLNRISISNELEWIIYTFEEMKIKYFLDAKNRNKRLISTYKENLVSPYSENNNFYNRIIKLQFKANLNFQLFKILFQKMPSQINCFEAFIYNMIQYTDISDDDRAQIQQTFYNYLYLINKDININQLKGYVENRAFLVEIHKELLSESYEENKKDFGNMNIQFVGHLITDSIHALYEIIKHTSIYGASFSLNHSFIANTHYRLYQWTKYFDWFIIFMDLYNIKDVNKTDLVNRFINHEKKFSIIPSYMAVSTYIENLNSILKNKKELGEYDIMHELKLIIDQDEISYIKEIYQAEKAINNYYSALETHTEGKAYKDFLNNIYYLNDDFNDNFFHFSIALERYRLNTGKIAEILDNLKKIVSTSSIYDHDNYIKTKINKKTDVFKRQF